ncbi:L-aspartate oxidase [Neolewinella agarilytica]|uniref:L-aspartate oxidase n=1 Tax=Neolewinella agarilytica TaxID=478744 RepID=A0A1H9GEE0_9BACT|nr:L-aspartate oxidase [Neolewinella agarilytica]SEQ48429.1 L-aspartate oxidase [Neolewinella agarilytica]
MLQTDVLIIGSGIAGLSTGIKLALLRPDLKIDVLTKVNERESNTSYAQGGVAAVWDHGSDNYEKHIADTLDAGAGLCDEHIVRIVVEEGPTRVEEIIEWGTRFDTDQFKKYDLGREGGHSENRILHYKDLTGWEIQRALSAKAATLDNLVVHEHFFALDLLTQHHVGHIVTRLTSGIECYGTYVLNRKTGSIDKILARTTVLCAGGNGQIYRSTTNPVIATGDGIAMAYRAKVHLENMEFVQFHPTALYNPGRDPQAFLVSEAVRGEGAILKRPDGSEFMQDYDPRGSLAPRDIVARAIDNEMKLGGTEYMCLDCTHIDEEHFLKHFPTIHEKCMSIGINPAKDMIPVTPACHYMCGGVKVDEYGKTSVNQLYACGECTSTGLHGANRLASNSLLEALVFGHRIAHSIAANIDTHVVREDIPSWNRTATKSPKEQVLITQSIKELKEVMSSYVGIVRSNKRLERARKRLELLTNETEDLYKNSLVSSQLCELRNLITIGHLVTKAANLRHESRGLHYTTDYPEKADFLQYSVL